MEKIILNGKVVSEEKAVISISSLGFTLGASVFEACRVYWNEAKAEYIIFRIKDHINRLYNSAKIMRMNLEYTKKEVLDMIILLVKSWNKRQDGYIRITIFVKSKSPGSSVYHPDQVQTGICITLKESEAFSDAYKGIKCCISSWRKIEDNSMPPRIKSACNYENTRLAGHEAILNGYENAILLNRLGKM